MSISQDWITNELEDTELEALHRSPSVEYSFYNAVRAGDMEAVNKNCEEDSFLHRRLSPQGTCRAYRNADLLPDPFGRYARRAGPAHGQPAFPVWCGRRGSVAA